MKPLVSIVIPCYKGKQFLREAIDSCLQQSHPTLEVIIVNDASPDQCGAIAEEYARIDSRIRVLHHERNQGVAQAFNTGFSKATGAYMARLAQDDWFEPNAIALMLQALLQAPSAGFVYCDEHWVDSEGKPIKLERRPPPETALKGQNKIGLCVMWRRNVWEQVGYFNSDYDAAEDFEYWLRVQSKFTLIHLQIPLLSFRQHPNMGSKVYSIKQDLLLGELKARSCGSLIQSRQIWADAYFTAGYSYGLKGLRWLSIKHLVRSALNWPLSLKPYKALIRFGTLGR